MKTSNKDNSNAFLSHVNSYLTVSSIWNSRVCKRVRGGQNWPTTSCVLCTYMVPNHKSLSYFENLSKQLNFVVIILQLQLCMLALIPSKSNNSTHTNISEIGDLQVLCTRPRSNLKGVGLLSLLITSDPAPSKGSLNQVRHILSDFFKALYNFSKKKFDLTDMKLQKN